MTWTPQAQAAQAVAGLLAQHGFRCIVPAGRGHGSTWSDATGRMVFVCGLETVSVQEADPDEPTQTIRLAGEAFERWLRRVKLVFDPETLEYREVPAG